MNILNPQKRQPTIRIPINRVLCAMPPHAVPLSSQSRPRVKDEQLGRVRRRRADGAQHVLVELADVAGDADVGLGRAADGVAFALVVPGEDGEAALAAEARDFKYIGVGHLKERLVRKG